MLHEQVSRLRWVRLHRGGGLVVRCLMSHDCLEEFRRLSHCWLLNFMYGLGWFEAGLDFHPLGGDRLHRRFLDTLDGNLLSLGLHRLHA